MEPYEPAWPRRWDAAGILGSLYSASYCSQRLRDPRRAAFAADLRATLPALEPSDACEEDAAAEARQA